jgi:hypothetical protein
MALREQNKYIEVPHLAQKAAQNKQTAQKNR